MNTQTVGATADDIAFHYDVGTAFYSLWLDPSMTYSCALWDGIDDDGSQTAVLAAAQRAKLLYHLGQASVAAGSRLLDVGCGWGSLLEIATREAHAEQATGLTLSHAQLDHVRALDLPGVDVRLESWRDHRPERPYDAIISIGAFEHFAHRGLSSRERIGAYGDFFERCHGWLPALGPMSLQTIAFDNANHEGSVADFIEANVFPGSTLPRLSEITSACDPYFSVKALRRDGSHYVRTLRAWAARLVRAKTQAQQIVGADTYRRYRVYLRLCELAFRQRDITLYRITLQRRPSEFAPCL